LASNETIGEGTWSSDFNSFDSDGFGLGYSGGTLGINQNTTTYAAWNWKANGAGVSNTDGSITSTVSANVDAGFSIVKWTGTGSTSTIGHGLSSAPEMWLTKRLSGDNWFSYHHGFGIDSHIYLNSTSAVITNSDDPWNSTAATSSVFTVRSTGSVNNNGEDYIAYCFHSVEGYSKVGSYTGNGSADGPFAHCGFRPAYVMIKATSAGTADNWTILDNKRSPYNDADDVLRANSSAIEYSNTNWEDTDFCSNGFKLRNVDGYDNGSGTNYSCFAFADHPFKYPNAR
jgi:hypothetical protein